MWDYYDELLQANIYINLDELDNFKNHNFQNWHKLRKEFEYPCKYWKSWICCQIPSHQEDSKHWEILPNM